MRLLIDTNIFLEIILDQEKAGDAKSLLTRTSEHEFLVSDYTLHSIGLLLFRKKKHSVFQKFLKDVIHHMGIHMLSLLPEEMNEVVMASKRFNLDFDDAYQYVVAKKHELILVSFDADFERTEIGRQTPAEILGR